MAASIVCVYKTGGDFSLQYVKMLARSVRHFSGMGVACLSDDPAVSKICEHIPLEKGWPRWWSKLEMLYHFDHALYLDLDTIVKGDISPLLDYPHKFTMLKGFSGTGRGASGVVAWQGDYSYLPEGFSIDMIPRYSKIRKSWGDQDFINDHLGFQSEYWQDIFPGMIASRKKSPVPERKNCTLLCYHGRPRPHQTGWSSL